jgi:hypothetical protein
MRNGEELTELPWRSISVDDALTRLMAERGETLDDVEWFTDGPKRAADFEHDIMRTKRHVYTIVKDYWEDDAYTCKVYVARVEDGHA